MNVRETKSSSTSPPTTIQPPVTQNESQEVILDIEKVASGEGECRRVESEQTLCDKSGAVSPKTENCFPYSQKPSGGLRELNIEEDSGRQSLGEDEQEQPSTTAHVREASSDIFRCQLSQPQAMDVELGSEPEREAVQWIDRHSSFFRLCFITCCCATQLIVQGQLGLTMIPLHYISDYLGTTENGQLSWMVASYGLTIGMFLVASGRLGDLYGPKLMWTLGFIFMISANLGTGFCKSPIPFDICRALAGVGSAMSLPNALAILGRTYPPGKIRNITFAILGALAPAGYCIGGGVASLFAQFVDVRWIWCAIFIAAFLAIGLYILPPDENLPSRSERHFDVPGAVLLALALGLFNFCWNQASVVGWETVYVYVLLIVSIFTFLAFFLWERRIGKKALIPLEVLTRKNLLVYLCLWLGWMSYGIFLLYTILFIHDIRGYTLPLTVTAQTSPFFFGGIVAALSVPFLIHRLPGHVIFFTAMCAFMIGNILAATAPVDGIYWGNTFFSILIGVFGADLSFPTGQLIVSNSVDVEFQGTAAGVVSMITNYSQSIGLGLAGTIERYVRGPDNLSRSDLLYGYRVSFYFAIALSALAVIVVGLFVRMPTEGKRLDDEREKAEH
ncbi:MFS transporter [Cryptococcus bacillisporus CA1873]|uniref:MFS transporter n=1 Tax=Cryptococcus bacillisporus CA1873 TaxID=1296111 RepID=A0ABR5B234_CRYGA|nr:MFS transporter [Cryptococcus bacillisporus CA1873]|eukprot:KIR57651.1 MFS transporter [Cryptococcus gattii CA1873]